MRLATYEDAGVLRPALAHVRVGPPVPDPDKILCVGLNDVGEITVGGERLANPVLAP